jgi:Family of unknown function (DUF6519)
MKADLSRSTYAPERHYSTVLMQQGRVQLDADWNEQQAIHRARIETEAADQIGASGTRIDAPGFGISVDTDKTLKISKGRIYVDGLLCENDADVLYNAQPFLPAPDPADVVNLLGDGDVAIAYLHARDRHVTAFDQPLLREQALDGPDTTTRIQTTWQVKILKVDAAAAIAAEKARLQTEIDLLAELVITVIDPSENARHARQLEAATWQFDHLAIANCALPYVEWDTLTSASTGTLTAQTAAPTTQETRCLIPPGSGYSGLENQLYRVEIIEGGVVGGTSTDVVRYVWSRENGSVVTPIVALDPATNTITVASLGPDDVLGFGGSVLVEISDDRTELLTESNDPPGFVGKGIVDPDKNEISLTDTPPAGFLQGILDRDPAKSHAKVRRWEGTGTIVTTGPVALEENIEVVFADGRYRTGDFWLIPARAGRGRLDGGGQGTIEWPKQPNSTNPAALLPFGVQHHYCRLALVTRAGGSLALLDAHSDCRNFFPATVDMNTLNYVGGDGQTTEADRIVPAPLRVSVLNGRWPVADARVLFTTAAGGNLSDGAASGSSIEVRTGVDGLATVAWTLDPDPTLTSQNTIVQLLDEAGAQISAPIIFTAQVRPPGEGADDDIHIEKIIVGESNPLENDLPVKVTDLAQRIVIACDKTVSSSSVGDKPTCYVTLDIDWPGSSSTVLGTWPLKLMADVGVSSSGNEIVWQPTKAVQNWLMKQLFQQLEEFGLPQRVLGHLILKGNVIWGRDDETLHLDGEAFGADRGDGTTVLELPSGNGRRGGEFDLWFWLEPVADFVIPDWGFVLRQPKNIFRPPIGRPPIILGLEDDLAQAISVAFDRGELALSPGAIFPDDYDFAPIKYDPELAKAHIAEAGLEGSELTIWLQPDLTGRNPLGNLAEVIRRALSDIGLVPQVTIFPGTHQAMLDQIAQRIGDDRQLPDAVVCDAPTVKELAAVPRAGFKGAPFVRF